MLRGEEKVAGRSELGFPREFFGASQPWAEAMKSEVAELFELVSKVVQKWARALKAKAEAEAH